MLQAIINFFLKLFTQFKGNKVSQSLLSGAIQNVQGMVSNTTQQFETKDRVDLGPERIPQESLAPNPAKIYACNVTAHLMMDIASGATPISLVEYYENCLKLNAIRKDCYILDYNKMRHASGLVGYKYVNEIIYQNSIRTIVNNLNAGVPMHVHVGGHFEMIKGYEHRDGELLFLVNDPGYQVDTHIESTTWRMFRFKDDKRIYSKNHQGQERKALSIGWYTK